MGIEIRAGGEWLTLHGEVGDLQWSTVWGAESGASGCELASWTFDFPDWHTPMWLARGAHVEIHDGSGFPIWSGVMSEPDRGRPWTCHARGYAFEASRFLALAGSPLQPTTNANDAVAAAVARGLPWTSTGSEFTVGDYAAAETVRGNYLSDLLDFAASHDGERWAVWADQKLRVEADPTAVSWMTTPDLPAMGTADDNYVSALYGRYVSAVGAGTPPPPTDWNTATATDAASEARWGRVEQLVDYTALGLLSGAWVGYDLSSRLSKAGARMGYTNGYTLGPGDLWAVGGVIADLTQVRAGQLLQVNRLLDANGNAALAAATTVVIGRTQYNHGDRTLQVEPVGMVARDLSSILANPEPREPTQVEING